MPDEKETHALSSSKRRVEEGWDYEVKACWNPQQRRSAYDRAEHIAMGEIALQWRWAPAFPDVPIDPQRNLDVWIDRRTIILDSSPLASTARCLKGEKIPYADAAPRHSCEAQRLPELAYIIADSIATDEISAQW